VILFYISFWRRKVVAAILTFLSPCTLVFVATYMYVLILSGNVNGAGRPWTIRCGHGRPQKFFRGQNRTTVSRISTPVHFYSITFPLVTLQPLFPLPWPIEDISLTLEQSVVA